MHIADTSEWCVSRVMCVCVCAGIKLACHMMMSLSVPRYRCCIYTCGSPSLISI